MICFYENVNSISRKTISFFCQKAHHGCQWIGKHIIVVNSACGRLTNQKRGNQVMMCERVIGRRSLAIGFWDLWIDVAVQTKNRRKITCVLCSPHVMRVCLHAHIVCVKAHTVSVEKLSLLGKPLLHSQDKVECLWVSSLSIGRPKIIKIWIFCTFS